LIEQAQMGAAGIGRHIGLATRSREPTAEQRDESDERRQHRDKHDKRLPGPAPCDARTGGGINRLGIDWDGRIGFQRRSVGIGVGQMERRCRIEVRRKSFRRRAGNEHARWINHRECRVTVHGDHFFMVHRINLHQFRRKRRYPAVGWRQRSGRAFA